MQGIIRCFSHDNKIMFAPKTGNLRGQIVGYDGVDKRIDLFASVIKNSDIYDLQELEHAYAPPFRR